MFEKNSIIEDVEITSVGSDGKAIARIDNFVLFVEDAVPGDIADIRIYRKKSKYAEGRAILIKKKSAHRVEAFCSHFGICGGCKWQHLAYSKQLEFKQREVKDALERIGKLELPEISPIIGSAAERYYRNKLEYTFSNKGWLTKEEFVEHKIEPALGFHVPQRFDKILDIEKCYLQDDRSNQIRLAVKEFCLTNNYEFFDHIKQSGDMRNIIIRNTSAGEWMVVVVFHNDDENKRNALLNHIKEKFPFITSLQYVINPKKNDTIFDLVVRLFHGRDYILEKMEDLTFRISAKSFYQTNSDQAYNLYKVVREFAGLTGTENVYDLYTGTGTIAAFISSKAKHVTGIDYIEDGIVDARKNAIENKIENMTFFTGDIKSTLNKDFINKNGRPDVIITDPPRAGMHENVIQAIIGANPEKIVYVSCNPSTQARDLQLLDADYRITKIQPVDMFPHTTHVENVVLLVKK